MEGISKKIIEQAQSGDSDAFSVLYQATYSRNYYVVLKMVKREADTEDILQDAYVKIFRNLKKFTYTGENSFASWSTKIVSNTALDFLRRKSPVLFSEMENEEGGIDFDMEDTSIETRPDLALEQKETSRIVQELLDELSDEQRICTIMHYVEQLSIAEIAEQCGCPEATIKSRLRYARIKIQGQGERLERAGIHLRHAAPMAILLLLLQQDIAQAAEKDVPALKPGITPPANMPGLLRKFIQKKLMAFLVAGGILIGVAGSYAVQNVNEEKEENSEDSFFVPTASPGLPVVPTERTVSGGGIIPAETPSPTPTVETQEPVSKPTVTPTKKPVSKLTPKPSPKPTRKPAPKPAEKPKKTAIPKPEKEEADNPDWDEDYVDWEE